MGNNNNNNNNDNDRPQEHHGVASERASAPAASVASRATTEALDKSERASSTLRQQQVNTTPRKMTPSSSGLESERAQSPSDAQLIDPDAKGNFQPFQMLMETEITLEYGKNLRERKVVHKEMLCCHSDGLIKYFKSAEVLRESYIIADKLRKQLKDFIHPRLSCQDFEELHKERQAIPLIVEVHENYPLRTYRKGIQQLVDDAIIDQVTKKNVTAPQAKGMLSKKDLPGMSVQSRLQGLQSKGVYAVAKCLSEKLRSIKQSEREVAGSKPIKAAAQGRIILQTSEARVVRSLVQWIYCCGVLNFEDAEHLYSIHALAVSLGMAVLAQKCLAKLLTETEGMIEAGFSEGRTLQQLLGLDSRANPESATPAKATATDNVVQVVFSHVLKDTKCPQRLLDLVISTLAECLDPGLWRELALTVNHRISLLLIEAMLERRQLKIEEVQDLDVRPESVYTDEGSMHFASDGQVNAA